MITPRLPGAGWWGLSLAKEKGRIRPKRLPESREEQGQQGQNNRVRRARLAVFLRASVLCPPFSVFFDSP